MTYFLPEGISSALTGLTTVFGMGTGVTQSLESPDKVTKLKQFCNRSLMTLYYNFVSNKFYYLPKILVVKQMEY